ncbi:hypothetical protein COLO4_35882 [Corchorus olitorius]|uniref:Uncharacterized protein n=1 Tax=Corchorus olitorius TaxID=93759 RepID=A0A1R3GCA5_9ROSI|nr:hypothetical protein COLO4_35882 [Corchorus olitorius]
MNTEDNPTRCNIRNQSKEFQWDFGKINARPREGRARRVYQQNFDRKRSSDAAVSVAATISD